jgi:predicted phage tail protein
MALQTKHKIFIAFVTIVSALAIVSAVFFMLKSQKQDAQMQTLTEMMDIEKQRLEKEYSDYVYEFQDITPTLTNDSLVKLVDEQKMKIQQLLTELKVTKSTDARRIQELQNELASVRKVMQYYVAQIDSLNIQNQRLTTENIEVKQRYAEVAQTVEQLAKEKEDLTQTVTRAAIIEMNGFSFTALNSKGRATKKLTQIAKFQFNYTIAKNVTAQAGDKTLFLRIVRPDDILLTKNANTFSFEGKAVKFSASKDFEYGNEAVSDAIYYNVDEMLPAGKYRAEFFLDGNRIGNYSFEI